MSGKGQAGRNGTAPLPGRDDRGALLAALTFACRRHSRQRRKDAAETPFINHPAEVAELLVRYGGGEGAQAGVSTELLQAALLHDTVEDTETTPGELEEAFGPEVRRLVMEVSDDKSLSQAVRKRKQVETAAQKSAPARMLKLADKISNIRDIASNPPVGWDRERLEAYLDWSREVYEEIRGTAPRLDRLYEETLAASRKLLSERCGPAGT